MAVLADILLACFVLWLLRGWLSADADPPRDHLDVDDDLLE